MTRPLSFVFAGVLALLAACAPPPAQTPAPTVAPVASTALPMPTNAATEAAFPVTIAHKYGSTEIAGKPQRIVTVGLTEQDALLALGVTPVGTTEWFGKYPGAIWPWAQDKLIGAVPEVVGDAATLNFEKIAALKPDVILAMYSGLTQEQYDLLARIAPTVAQPAAYVDYGIPWQELTRNVGKVVGQTEQAEQLVKDVEARFEQARAAHPAFSGATAVVATPYEGIWVYGPEDVRGRLLTNLGFTLPEKLAEVTGNEFGGNLSLEKADMLDVDAIIWLDASEAKGPLGGPLYSTFKVVKEGREVFLSSYNDPLGGATSFVSVLSLPYLLDGLTPMLAAAVDGDPATRVPARPTTTPPAEATPAASSGTITLTDASGATVVVPANPQRIVTLSEQDLDAVLALGLKPVGTVNGRGQQTPPLYLMDRLTDVISVGSFTEPSLEQIATLKPDLILIGGIFPAIEKLPEQLRAIAPTVVTYKLDDDWKTAFKATAAAINESEKAETFLTDYGKKADKVKNTLGANAGAASIVRWNPDGPVIMALDSFSSRVARDAGFTRPVTQQIEGYSHSDPISLEELSRLDGDWLFLGTLNADGQKALESAQTSPLFKQLEAAKAERVLPVDGTIWTSRGGPLAALIVLDDIAQAIAK